MTASESLGRFEARFAVARSRKIIRSQSSATNKENKMKGFIKNAKVNALKRNKSEEREKKREKVRRDWEA